MVMARVERGLSRGLRQCLARRLSGGLARVPPVVDVGRHGTHSDTVTRNGVGDDPLGGRVSSATACHKLADMIPLADVHIVGMKNLQNEHLGAAGRSL